MLYSCNTAIGLQVHSFFSFCLRPYPLIFNNLYSATHNITVLKIDSSPWCPFSTTTPETGVCLCFLFKKLSKISDCPHKSLVLIVPYVSLIWSIQGQANRSK